MLKFEKTIRRVSMKDHPLAPGSISICFTENKDGKLFSELVDEILQATNVEETQTKLDILKLKYWVNVEISSAPTVEDVQDLRLGFTRLDKASFNCRVEAAETEEQKVKESAKRISANIHVKNLFEMSDYIQEFDTCTLDTSEMKLEDIEAGMVHIVSVAQRENPSVYIISAELANKLLEKDFQETALGKLYNSKIKFKNVFASEKDLKNIFVRSI